jgi:glutamate--cysteine ligase catalytic subunit
MIQDIRTICKSLCTTVCFFFQVQLTDFENAAFATFVVLITRVILSFNLSLLIPLSKVDENLAAAQKRDAARKEKFYFRVALKICKSDYS